MKQRFLSSVVLSGLVMMFGAVGCDDSADDASQVAPADAMRQTSDRAEGEGKATAPPEQPAKTVALKVDGMHCTGCAAALKGRLAQVPGVVMAEVSFERGEAKIGVAREGPGAETLIRQIRAVNPTYTAEPIAGDAPATEAEPTSTDAGQDAEPTAGAS